VGEAARAAVATGIPGLKYCVTGIKKPAFFISADLFIYEYKCGLQRRRHEMYFYAHD